MAAATGLEWLLRNILAFPVWKRMFHLDSEYGNGGIPHPAPLVSVVVAAKDEEDNIEKCVAGIITQDYENLQIILVNDRSTDRTGEIIDRLASENSQIQAMHIDKLPKGWCGKNHAMQHGIAASTGLWIAMTDADCSLNSSRMLTSVIKYATDEDADMVTLMPTLETYTFWERLLLPVCAGILMIWFPPKKVNNPDKKQSFANGQFMLIKRSAYTAVGTHEAIKGSLIEDIDLARMIKKSGHNLRFVLTKGLFSVRMYSSLNQIARGWTRIFIGAFTTIPFLLAELGVLIGRGLIPLATCITSWIMYAGQYGPGHIVTICVILSTAALLLQLVMMCRFYHHTCTSAPYGLLYPFTCSVISGIIIKTLWIMSTGGHISWRGTEYPHDQ